MADDNRRSLKRNVTASMFIQVLSLLVNLISKRAIGYYLGIEYLGIQTVYSNFCDVLTFAFGGMGTAVLFRLYGPLARNDKRQIKSIYCYFDELYGKFGWIVLIGGFLSTFLVLALVDANVLVLEIVFTYIAFMLSVVFYNRQLLRFFFIQADQRRYVVALVTGSVDTIALIVQVLALKYFRSYLLFVSCILVKNLIINYLFRLDIKKNFPYLFDRENTRERLDKEERQQIRKDVTDMVVYRFGNVLINNTDSIYINYFINTVMVGVFSNYQFVVMGVRSIVGALYEAIRGKIGHNIQTEDKNMQYRDFIIHSWLNAWIIGVCICCFYYLVQDFIGIWMGDVERLPDSVLWILIVNFYLEEARNATKVYRESAGLFQNIKIVILLKGFFNIILSYFLGVKFGLMGILVATSISTSVTLFWYEPLIVYRYFEKSICNEILYNLYTIVLTVVTFLITGLVVRSIDGTGIIMFFLKAIICFVSSNMIYLVTFVVYMKIKGVRDGY